jgi:hypothetical protein
LRMRMFSQHNLRWFLPWIDRQVIEPRTHSLNLRGIGSIPEPPAVEVEVPISQRHPEDASYCLAPKRLS